MCCTQHCLLSYAVTESANASLRTTGVLMCRVAAAAAAVLLQALCPPPTQRLLSSSSASWHSRRGAIQHIQQQAETACSPSSALLAFATILTCNNQKRLTHKPNYKHHLH
jgi:hypothetical protein